MQSKQDMIVVAAAFYVADKTRPFKSAIWRSRKPKG